MIIPVKTSTGKYNIILEKGSINNVKNYLKLNRKVLIVTDNGVPEEYSKIVANQCEQSFIVTLPQGEASKNFENYKMLLEKMVECNFSRTDCVIAVGGGVVGDLAGFVASSYMRGIDFYNIPTTVLSQVDSSIGGKVAIDFGGYKNIVGAFYPPKAVIIDSNTLKTLPQRQISNGLVESVKMALTFDKKFFELFENKDINENIDLIIEKSLKIKRYVVERDEKENCLRKVLNFGHTLGHAIEVNNSDGLFHGECVALGMLPMCENKVKERLLNVLAKLNLPVSIDFDIENIRKTMAHDKKMSGKNITAVFVEKIGKYILKDISLEELSKKIGEI